MAFFVRYIFLALLVSALYAERTYILDQTTQISSSRIKQYSIEFAGHEDFLTAKKRSDHIFMVEAICENTYCPKNTVTMTPLTLAELLEPNQSNGTFLQRRKPHLFR